MFSEFPCSLFPLTSFISTGLSGPVVVLFMVLVFWVHYSTLLTVLRRLSRSKSYSLLLCGLFYEAICFISYLVSFCSCVFSPFSIAITSLGEERANLSAFRTFVRFVLVWICRFPLPLGVWEGLRFVIVALPGLFSYLSFSDRYRDSYNISNNWKKYSDALLKN